jgi:futalosine hydrolase
MRVLIVTATDAEAAPLLVDLRRGVDVLVTGVGMVATAARASRALALDPYDLALNVGVCGSFDPSLPPGTAVHVVADRVAELGAEDGDRFLAFEELQLPGEAVYATPSKVTKNAALARLPAVSGLTVNTVHGRERSIEDVVRRFAPQVETMEGAAFMAACAANGVPFAQIRGVSNMVERRNRAAWRLSEGIDAAARAARAVLDEI